MKQNIMLLTTLFAILNILGCGGSNSSSSSKSDSLQITQSSNNFNLIWNKRYQGYSEVVYTSEVSTENRGTTIISNNYEGKHTLGCSLSSIDSNYVQYYCTGEAPSVLGGQSPVETYLSFSKGVEYKILINKGLELEHGSVEYILEFNGNTLTIH